MMGRFQLVIIPRNILSNPFSGLWSKIFTSIWFDAPRLAGSEVILFLNVYGKARCTIRYVGDELVHPLRHILDQSLRRLVVNTLPPSYSLLPLKSATKHARRLSPLPLGPNSPSPSVADLKGSAAQCDCSRQTPSRTSNSPKSYDKEWEDIETGERSDK